MKVDRRNGSDSLACPSCGETLGESPASQPQSSDEAAAEVIVSGKRAGIGGRASDLLPPIDSPDDDLPPVPEIATPASLDPGGALIPRPRQEKYQMPELISNIGERAWSPNAGAGKEAPKFDASRMASTEDAGLAAEPEREEGAVKAHIARKITGWDLDKDETSEKPVVETRSQSKVTPATVVIAIVSLLFVGLIIYGVARSVHENEPITREIEKPAEEVAREALSGVERDVMDKKKETFAAAGKAIENFLNASNYQERLAMVRDAQRVEPLMEAYYKRNPDGAIDFRPPEDGWVMQPYESFLLATVIAKDFGKYAIAVDRQEDGRYLIDWESYVGYCEIPWDEITEKKSLEPFLMRARASVGDYYNFGYLEKEWACVQFQDRKLEHTVYGYVKFDDPVFENLTMVMSRRGAVYLTVKLASPPDGKAPNQFLITGVVAKGWVASKESQSFGSEESDGEAAE